MARKQQEDANIVLRETVQEIGDELSSYGNQFLHSAADALRESSNYGLAVRNNEGDVLFHAPLVPTAVGALFISRMIPRQVIAVLLFGALLLRIHITLENNQATANNLTANEDEDEVDTRRSRPTASKTRKTSRPRVSANAN